MTETTAANPEILADQAPCTAAGRTIRRAHAVPTFCPQLTDNCVNHSNVF
jgi:hypothetical protein